MRTYSSCVFYGNGSRLANGRFTFLILSPFPSCPSSRLFELEPTAKAVFGFKASADVEKELYESPTFSRHAIILIQMFDYAFSMLGPDIDLWSEMMLDLGEKHVAYGVQLEHYRGMGQALVYALREQLGGRFTKEIKEAWVEVYGALSSDMIRAQKSFC